LRTYSHSPFTAEVTDDAEQAFVIDVGAKTITRL
jgi:hypothetical protein